LPQAIFPADEFYRSDVGHVSFPLQLTDVLPELLLRRDLQHPVQDDERVDDALLVLIAFVKQFGQPPFCGKPLLVVCSIGGVSR
jgi:hypothetical protein